MDYTFIYAQNSTVYRKEKTLSAFIRGFLQDHLLDYPTHSNLTYLWGFGSLSGIFLCLQICTGIFLAMYYIPSVDFAFASVEYIMREVNYGWLIRYMHSNGASFFFIVVYLHIGRGLYFRSYLFPYNNLWACGIFIFILMIITAFLGYVLPWGQMSLWGATVITNLISAIPIIGTTILEVIWGGFSVDNPTLKRFAILHYYLPILIVILVLIHLSFLHKVGSTNFLGKLGKCDMIAFTPYYYLKDLFGLFIFLFLFVIVIFYYPNVFGHPDNYIEANALVTPHHIVPEWYLLPFYAILRSITDKLFGVISMGLALVIMIFLHFFDKFTVFGFILRHYIFYYAFAFYCCNRYYICRPKQTLTYYVRAKLNPAIHRFLDERGGRFGLNYGRYNGEMDTFIEIPDFLNGFMHSNWYLISASYKGTRSVFINFYWFFIFNLIFLGWIGACPADMPFVIAGKIGTIYYFFFLVLLLRWSYFLESFLTIFNHRSVRFLKNYVNYMRAFNH